MQKQALFYEELSYKINGILFAAHNEIGCYAKEKQYGDVVERLLRAADIPFKREVPVGNSRNILDFVVEGKIVLELKAKRIITKEDYYQTQRYLQETGLKLGILVNFRDKYIKPKRIIRIENWQK